MVVVDGCELYGKMGEIRNHTTQLVLHVTIVFQEINAKGVVFRASLGDPDLTQKLENLSSLLSLNFSDFWSLGWK